MNRILAALLAALILLACVGCGDHSQVVPELKEPVGVELDTAQVYKGTVCHTQTYEGHIVPKTQPLSFSASGKLSEICVKLGDTVQKGQVLARLNAQDARTQITSLEQQLQNCRDRGDLAQRKIQLDIDIAQTEYEMLRASGADEAECNKKSAAIAALKLQLEQQKANTQLQLDQLNKELNAQYNILNNAALTAPFSGKVTYLSSSRTGTNIGVDTIVVCLSDPSVTILQVPYIEQSILESADAVYAKIMDVRFDAQYIPYDQQEFISQMVNQEQLHSHFQLATESGVVQSGQYAVLFVESVTREDALLIPVNAILQDRVGRYVYKMQGDKRIRCDVQVGIVTETKAQVLSGLQEGDVVYVNG